MDLCICLTLLGGVSELVGLGFVVKGILETRGRFTNQTLREAALGLVQRSIIDRVRRRRPVTQTVQVGGIISPASVGSVEVVIGWSDNTEDRLDQLQDAVDALRNRLRQLEG